MESDGAQQTLRKMDFIHGVVECGVIVDKTEDVQKTIQLKRAK